MTKPSISPELLKVSEFLETLESLTQDKQTASQIRQFMDEQGLWILPTPANDTLHVPKNPEVDEQIVYNGVVCLNCGDSLESRHRHDYVKCSCPNEAMVDGGHAYARYGAVDMKRIVKITYTMTDPHVTVRRHVKWGTRGKNGDQELEFVPLMWLSDNHLSKLVEYDPAAAYYKTLFEREISYRELHNISVPE